jgi:hypothetical protein
MFYIIRVMDGFNLRNSKYPYWGVKRTGGQKSIVQKMEKGDVLCFLTSKPNGGKVIAMAKFTAYYDREDEPLIPVNTVSNEEQGWVGGQAWDIQIHYDLLRYTDDYDIQGCIAHPASILKYDSYKEHFNQDLFAMYERVSNDSLYPLDEAYYEPDIASNLPTNFEQILDAKLEEVFDSLKTELNRLNYYSSSAQNIFPSAITRYDNCDILIHQADIERLGFDKTKTEEEMIQLAIEYGCKIVTRSGKNGKWYLKGKNRTIDYLKEKLDKNLGKYRDGVYCLLLE